MIVLLWNTKEDILKTVLVTLFPSVAMKEAFKLQKDVKVVNCNVSTDQKLSYLLKICVRQ